MQMLRSSLLMGFIEKYDSAAYMLQAISKFLDGKDFQVWDNIPHHAPKMLFWPVLHGLNQLPEKKKIQLSVGVSTTQAVKAKDLSKINEESLAKEILCQIPKKKYPVIAIGSSNGALVHLYAALGIPWLPQTNLMLINREDPITDDDMEKDATWGEEFAKPMLDKNPNLKLHQMNDPGQDRFMAQKMTYFRIKFLSLPKAYQKFIEDCLEPGGTILIINCHNSWPATKIHDRHYYQIGGYGGITLDEYMHGGKRVKEFLKRNGSKREKFIIPKITGKYIEAEWGYEEKMTESIKALSKKKKYEVKQLLFTEPDDPIEPIAQFYKQWYKKLGRPTDKLLVESFMLVEPYWCLKTGCIPFWAVFNAKPSYDHILKYIEKNSFDYIYLTLFSNIVNSIDVPKGKEWEKLVKKAKKEGKLLGVNIEKFPFDLLSAFKFFEDIKKEIPFRYDLPDPITLKEFEDFLSKNKNYKMQLKKL